MSIFEIFKNDVKNGWRRIFKKDQKPASKVSDSNTLSDGTSFVVISAVHTADTGNSTHSDSCSSSDSGSSSSGGGCD